MMNIAEISDLQQLKALAYDQLMLQEQVQRNLALISARIAEIEQQMPAAQSAAPSDASSDVLSGAPGGKKTSKP